MKIAIIGAWHVHAERYTEELMEDKRCEVAVVWDDDEARGMALAEKVPCAYTSDLDAILRDPTIEAVCVCSQTAQHTEHLIKCAEMGKHIFTEKVLALTGDDARRIEAAVKLSGKSFCISFPHKCRPGILLAKQLVDAGALGKITYARVRNVHNGASANWLPPHFYDASQCGGGAMMDLGAHPMYTLCWLLGTPKTVQSLFTDVTGKPVEDNAACLMSFGGGAIGVSETGFVSQANPYTLEISGTKGSFMLYGKNVFCSVIEGEIALPEETPLPIRQWVDACEKGAQLAEFGIEEAVRLTDVMEAAYAAARSGKTAPVRGT